MEIKGDRGFEPETCWVTLKASTDDPGSCHLRVMTRSTSPAKQDRMAEQVFPSGRPAEYVRGISSLLAGEAIKRNITVDNLILRNQAPSGMPGHSQAHLIVHE